MDEFNKKEFLEDLDKLAKKMENINNLLEKVEPDESTVKDLDDLLQKVNKFTSDVEVEITKEEGKSNG